MHCGKKKDEICALDRASTFPPCIILRISNMVYGSTAVRQTSNLTPGHIEQSAIGCDLTPGNINSCTWPIIICYLFSNITDSPQKSPSWLKIKMEAYTICCSISMIYLPAPVIILSSTAGQVINEVSIPGNFHMV